MDHVWIVILNYRGWDDTRVCLQSIQDAAWRGVNVVVVDNGGEEQKSAALRREFPWCTVLVNGDNLGFSAGNNIGIRHALDRGAAWVLLLNNDMVVLSGLLERLLQVGAAGFGIVGPGISYMDEPDLLMPTAFAFCPPHSSAIFQSVEVAPGAVRCVDVVMGCAMFVSRDVFADVGLLWPEYFLQHEETDYCLRTLDRGWRVGAVGDVLARHKGGSSFRREGMAQWYYYDCRNLFLLARRLRSLKEGAARARRLVGRSTAYARYQYLRAVREGRAPDALALSQGVWDGATGRFGRRISRIGPGAHLVRVALA
ncbi:MAG: glycosyltransferase family 2 protein, partial [Acidobacteria bacterium]|nr:glycosyltransferase family 2 protein [Acidobacteriota bacterium]